MHGGPPFSLTKAHNMATKTWAPVTTSDVLGELSIEETSYLEEHGVQGSLAGVLTRTINQFRGAVVSGGGCVGKAGEIAYELHGAVVAYAKWTWIAANPILASFRSEDRMALFQDAKETMERLRAGTLRVARPPAEEILTDVSAGVNAVQVVTAANRQTITLDGTGAMSTMDGLP